MMRPVVLAAGRGSRLEAYTEEGPKLFVEVNGKTIFDWQLEALSPLAEEGIIDDEITLVLGHGFEDVDSDAPLLDDELEAYLPKNSPFDYHIITIPNWDAVENATSARRAIESIDDHMLLLCGDVIITEALLRTIVETFENEHRDEGASTVGAIEGIQDEMTAVRWNGERTITDYGAIEGHKEVGVFVLNSHHFDTARQVWETNETDWFPIVFPEVQSKVVTVNEDHHYEINTERHLRRATAELPFDE